MESPGAYPDSPGMDDMDVIYHCKGCGEVRLRRSIGIQGRR